MKLSLRPLAGFASIFVWLLAATSLLQFSERAALAATSTMSDGNSSITFDPTSSAGINNWSVNGCNQLNQDWFFYQVGSGPALAINTIGAPTVNQSTASSLSTTYANSQISVQITYQLTGGSGNNSAFSVQLSVQNLTQGGLTLYNYSDFSLGGSLTSVQMGKNLSGLFNEADVSGAGGGLVQTAVTPGANSGEAALFNSTLSKLAAGTALSGNLNAGPGEATYAFGWDFTAGQSRTLSIVSTMQAVPELPDRALPWIGFGACLLMARLLPRLEYRFARRNASGFRRSE